ncbi:MAG: hypothetical protein L6R48_20900 [Planctomycetes bacterium]|nr:hypothetical protein [Planctomycetota bacterium]
MASIDIGSTLSKSIARLKANPGFHIISCLLVGIIGSAVFGLLQGPMMVGYFKALEKEDRGEMPEIGDVFKGFDDFVPALIAGVVGGLVVGIGFMLCLIPGILILPLFPLALYFVAKGEKDGINALKRAWPLVKASLVPAALAALVVGLVGYVGIILCFVGVILTMPIAMIGFYLIAKQLAEEAPAAGAPATT